MTTKEKFHKASGSLRHDQKIKRMKEFVQHGDSSTYDHCVRVAEMSFVLNEKLHLHAKEDELLRGAMLHDYFLYDWHHHDGGGLHGYTHPAMALANAEADFELTEKERNIIRSHMWPLTLFHMPLSREAWLVCLTDKFCSIGETFSRH
jgi:uncharacterized protein